MVDASLGQMNGLQRTSEAFRYFMLSLEFWMSPDGHVREWVKTNTRLAAFMAAPTVLLFPVVTVALWELSSSINALTTIASKLVFLPVLALLALVSITIVLRIISVFKR